MRVTTAFNRVVDLPGAWVAAVSFSSAGIVLGLRRRGRWLRCPCGTRIRSRYDTSRRRWRHLDFGACKVWLEADVYRVDCPRCARVRTEAVPWARPGARFSRDFEDLLTWLAQRMDKTAVARLLRCSWQAVNDVVTRVVAEHIDDSRLDNLYRIGVDEISYRRGHKYLTIVADHDTSRVVWIGQERTKATFEAFFDTLGTQRTAALQAVTLDASSIYLPMAAARAPQATICVDPFHVISWVNEVVHSVYRAEGPVEVARRGRPTRRDWRRTRTALLTGAEKLTDDRRDLVNQLRRHSYRLWRAWQLKERLRDLYRAVDPRDAGTYLRRWCTAALRSKIPAFANLVRRIRKHHNAIIASIHHGLSNSRVEGINAKIRLIQRRGYGFRNLNALTAMIYLCLGGITITLPTQT